MSEQFAVRQTLVAPGWRPKLGLLLFMVAVVSPLLVPVALVADLPSEVKGALSGLLLFGVPMALMMFVVGLIGQPAFLFIKSLVGQGRGPSPVGVTRYRIGLVFACIGALVSWIEPLVSPKFPEIAARRVLIGTLADGMVLVSLFVLGGNFWDKVHALFVHDARVVDDGPGKTAVAAEEVQVGWRFYVGVAIIALGFGVYLLIPIASAAGWSTAQVASLTGGLFIANKVGLISAIAIMGKPGFNHVKRLVGGVARKFAPSQQVNRSRYRLGLVLFMIPVLLTWLAPYITGFVRKGGVYEFLQELALEVLLLVGLYILGGEFWGKLRALFSHRANVEFGADTSAA